MTNSLWPVGIVVALLVAVSVALVLGIRLYNRKSARQKPAAPELASPVWATHNLSLTPVSSQQPLKPRAPSVHADPKPSKIDLLLRQASKSRRPPHPPAVSAGVSAGVSAHPPMSARALSTHVKRTLSNRTTRQHKQHKQHSSPPPTPTNSLHRPRRTRSPPRLSLRLSTTSMLLPRDWTLDERGLYKRNSVRNSVRNNARTSTRPAPGPKSPFHVNKRATRSPRTPSLRSARSFGSTVLMINPDAVFDVGDLSYLDSSDIDVHLTSLLHSTFRGHNFNVAKRCSSLSATSSHPSTRHALPSPKSLNCDKPLPSYPQFSFQSTDNVRSHENLLMNPFGHSDLSSSVHSLESPAPLPAQLRPALDSAPTSATTVASSDQLHHMLFKPLDDMHGAEVVSLPPQVHVVIHKYTPELDDELELRRGDKLIMHQLFNDGWCHAHLLLSDDDLATNTRVLEGICPRVCISARPVAI